MAGDVDHVVDPADHPDVAVGILAGGVADQVAGPAEAGEVGLDEALVLLVEGAEHRGPGPLQDQQALAFGDRLAVGLADHLGRDPRERGRRRPRLGRRDPRQRRDHDRAGLRLPPGVDDRAASSADHLVVPEPGLRVDRLADRAEEAQGREVVALGDVGAPFDEGADRGRGGVEDGGPRLLGDLPPDPLVGIVRCPLPHHRGGTVGERAVDDVGVAGDPADVGGTPVDV